MNTPRKLVTAQVGVGHFGGARRNYMRQTGLFDLVACFDLKEEEMAHAEEHDGAKPCASFEAMLETPGLEALVISTGAKFHAEQIIAGLERGLHVFTEKPLCSTPQEVQDLIAAEKKSGKVVVVGHNALHTNPVSLRMKEMFDSGELGEICHFEKTTGHHGGFCIKPGNWRGDPEKNPGGMLFQCGVHGYHELMFLFGPIKAVTATMRDDINKDTETVDIALTQLEFESGLIGSLNAFHVSPYRHYFNIYGTKSNLYMENYCFDTGMKFHKQTFTVDNAEEPWVPEEMPVSQVDMTSNLRNFYDAVVNDGTPSPSLLDGARAVSVVFAAEKSAQEGRRVEIPQLEG
jgi:predicted dehydrogenase